MAYKINGVIRLADNGDANLGLVTATEFDGKVSKKAITEQTAGAEADVTGADEILVYDQQTDSLLRVSVDDFISASGIGTLISDFTHVDSDSLVVTGLSTLGGVEIGAGIITASSPTGIVTFYGDGSQLTGISGSGGSVNLQAVTDAGNTTNNSVTIGGTLTLSETPTPLRYGTSDRGGQINLYQVSNVANAGVEIEAVHPLSSQIMFTTVGIQRMRIDQAGNVRIGGTLDTSPNISLSADGSYVGTRSVTVDRTATTNPTFLGSLNGTVTYRVYASGSVTTAGDVLIGGTLPSSPNISLNADGTAEFAGRVNSDNAFESDRTSGPNSVLVGKLNGTQNVNITAGGNADFAGDVTAASFSGDGSQLTNLPGGGSPGDPAAAEADKLTTARTLWGQSFDGTANVIGSLSDVVDIDFTGEVKFTTATASPGGSAFRVDTGGVDVFRVYQNGETVIRDTAYFGPAGATSTISPNGNTIFLGDMSIRSGSTTNIYLQNNGTATLAGDIQSGGNPNNGIQDGAKLRSAGFLQVSRPSGSTLFAGYTTGSSSATSIIDSDGSAQFASNVDVGTQNTSDDNAYGVKVFSGGIVQAQRPIGNTGTIYGGFQGSTKTVDIKADGSAEFAGDVVSGSNPSLSEENEGIVLRSRGTVTVNRPSSAIYQGYTTGNSSPTFVVNADGSAEFAGGVTATSFTGDGSGLTNVPGGSGGPAAESADKLSTSRTLWGQSFDGTANVSGNLTNVGNITGNNVDMIIQPVDSTNPRDITIRGNNDTDGTGGDVTIGDDGRGTIRFKTGSTSNYRFGKAGNSIVEGVLDFDDLTVSRRFTFPDTTGTVALTSSTVNNANNINVDEKSDNVDYQVLFSDDQGAGYQRPYIDSVTGQFKYNPSTNTLTAGNFVGDGSGLTNVPGGSGGPAAAEADKLLLAARNTTNATHYLTFATARTGQQSQYTDTGLTYNPSTNTISATFSGNGSALTSLDASNLSSGTIPDARFPATLPAADGSNLTNLTSGNLVGALPAIDGSALLNLPGGSGGPAAAEADKLTTARTLWGQSFDGTANVTGSMTLGGNIVPDADGTRNLGSSATRWNNLYSDNANITATLNVRGAIDLADNDQLRMGSSDDAKLYFDGTNVELELETGASGVIITNNGTTTTTITKAGAITATSFTGDGSGLTNVPGGSGGPAAAEADKLLLVARNTTNAAHYLTFSTAVSGQQTQYTDTGLTYNPSTNTISATFSGNGSALTSLNASNLGSGTVPDARFPATLPAADGSNLTNLTSANLVGALPAIDGSALTGLPGSGGGAPGAATIAVTDESVDTANFLVFTNAATGNQAPKTGTNLTFNSATGRLTATSFGGNGSALTSLNASNLSSGTVNTARLPATYTKAASMTVSATGTASDMVVRAGDNVTIQAGNESAGVILLRHSGGTTGARVYKSSSSSVFGSLNMENITANRTFTFPDGSGTLALTSDTITNAVNATTATNANNINVADESSDTTCFPVFTTTATGNQPPRTNGTTLQYNASTGLFSSTAFAGDGSSLTDVNAAKDGIFYENDQNVTSDYTITTGKNAMSAGPITIDTGVTVTVPATSTWTVV